MRIEEQEANTNVKIEGEIIQLQTTRDREIRDKSGISKDKVSIYWRKNSSKTVLNRRIDEIRNREEEVETRRYHQQLTHPYKNNGDCIRITNKIKVNHNENSDLDKYATVIKITTTKRSKHTIDQVWVQTDRENIRGESTKI